MMWGWRFSWQTWAIWIMAWAVVLGWVPALLEMRRDWIADQARLALPKTEDLFHVGYVELARGEDGHLVVFSDGRAVVDFEGRYKVTLRDRSTQRHVFTPQWSEWLDYVASPDGPRYRQPETVQWWADKPSFVEPPPSTWVMETCWQARITDDHLGLVELEPVCRTSVLGRP